MRNFPAEVGKVETKLIRVACVQLKAFNEAPNGCN